MLFLCKLAEEWSEDSKHSIERVERALVGDEEGENKGLVGVCRSLSQELVARSAMLRSQQQELQTEVERLRVLLGNTKGDELRKDPVEIGPQHDGTRREVFDNEMAKIMMKNEILEIELLDLKKRRIERVDPMVGLDREVEEKDSALMEVLWPQGEAADRKRVQEGHYTRDEVLGKKREQLAADLDMNKGWCGVM